MSWLTRLLNISRRDRLHGDLDEEMRFHIAARTEELIRSGIPADEAARQASRRFGNRLVLRESSADAKLVPWLESIWRDIGFGARLCRKNPIVTASAVVSLSLAIGACTAAFALLDALILRPLPVSEPNRLVHIEYRTPGDAQGSLSFNYPLFERLREAGRSQVQLFGVGDQSRRDAIFDDRAGQPEKVYAQWISGDAFDLLGVKPALGRLLTAADDRTPGQHPVAVLSYDFWSSRFARNPNVLGRWLTVRDKHLQVVGVAQQGFTGLQPGIMTDLWAPTMMWDESVIRDSGTRWFQVWGRLQPSVAPEQAEAILQPPFTHFRRDQAVEIFGSGTADRIKNFVDATVHLQPAANGVSSLRRDFERALWILAAVAALVLLIACANVAGLLVARGAARQREMALRISIGAGRGRLIQQVLIESALLATAACLLGALIAVTAAPQVASMLSTSRSIVRLDTQLDWRLLAFLSIAGTVVTFLFGLLPALRASGVSPNDVLKAGGGKHTAGITLFRPLLAAQTAFSFVVLFLAGMCLASFSKLLHTDLGFDSTNIAIATIQARELPLTRARAIPAWEQLLDRLRQTPGIESASLSSWALFEGRGRNKAVRIPGQSPDRPSDTSDPWYLGVSPRFFKTMRIPLLEGSDFEWRDTHADSPSAVIVNRAFAQRYFPNESALGRSFWRVDTGSTLVTQRIIGIVGDARYTSVRGGSPPTVYDPYRVEPAATVQLRTPLDPAALRAILRDTLPRVHPAFQLYDITLQSTLIDNTLVRDRALALLSAFFSIIAIVLVAVGLYGVLSYSVIHRTREIGIRLALGAAPRRVVGWLLTDIVLVSAIGLMIGAAGGLSASRFLTSLLYEVRPSDASSIAMPLLALLLAAALSALIPLLRAIRIDPTNALRYD